MKARIQHILIFVMIVTFCFVNYALASGKFDDFFTKYLKSRPGITTGYGPVIDDLEQMADKASHGMRDTSDPGGWAHELSHYCNAMFRVAANDKHGRDYNGFYVLGGYATVLPEPDITLEYVGRLVPKERQGYEYKDYFINSQRWWNKQPLFLVDEAIATVNALQYHVTAGKYHRYRGERTAIMCYHCDVLLQAVREGDPHYTHLEQLQRLIAWNNLRGRLLMKQHRLLSTPSK